MEAEGYELPSPSELGFHMNVPSPFTDLYNDLQHFNNTHAMEQLLINRPDGKRSIKVDSQDVMKEFAHNCPCTNPNHNTVSWRMNTKQVKTLRYIPVVFVKADSDVTECTHLDGFCVSCFTASTLGSFIGVENATYKIVFTCPDCGVKLDTNMFVCDYYVPSIAKRGRPPRTDNAASETVNEPIRPSPAASTAGRKPRKPKAPERTVKYVNGSVVYNQGE